MDIQAKETSVIVLCRCFIICISGCYNVGDGSPVPMSRLYGYTGKRNFGNCFVQTFHYLHIRVLHCRGGVSPPVTPSSSIHNPANPSRLGDACLACFAIRQIPPVSATPAPIACANQQIPSRHPRLYRYAGQELLFRTLSSKNV